MGSYLTTIMMGDSEERPGTLGLSGSQMVALNLPSLPCQWGQGNGAPLGQSTVGKVRRLGALLLKGLLLKGYEERF